MRLRGAEFKILQHLRNNRVFAQSKGDVHLMLSGGKDSVALLELLTKLTHLDSSWSKLTVRLFLHHFNHKRRGSAADLDEELCIDLARQTGNPIQIYYWPERLEKELSDGKNFHELAREWRYTSVIEFAQMHSPEGSWVIATAHHRRDHAESVLLNLARGCSAGGLLGIEPWNHRTRYLRPFLWLDHELTDAYISGKLLPHREDSSNQSLHYARNKIRHNVIPSMLEVNSQFIEHLWLLSGDIQTRFLSTQDSEVAQIQNSSAIQADNITSLDELKGFITKATRGKNISLTRAKLANALIHVRKARAHPSAELRYNFALSEQFEIIITSELIEIKAYY
jgi:tRNA(Ile)-lysidine synthetase-like protein